MFQFRVEGAAALLCLESVGKWGSFSPDLKIYLNILASTQVNIFFIFCTWYIWEFLPSLCSCHCELHVTWFSSARVQQLLTSSFPKDLLDIPYSLASILSPCSSLVHWKQCKTSHRSWYTVSVSLTQADNSLQMSVLPQICLVSNMNSANATVCIGQLLLCVCF